MSFRQCRQCVLDNADVPDISFDNDICNYCSQWKKEEEIRDAEAKNLPWHVYQIRKDGQKKKYDILLGLSGGVDSSYALKIILQHGLRPLCWSLDNGFNTKEADENIMRLVESSKVPFLKEVINLDAYRELYAALIKSGIKNLEAGYDHILFALSYQLAHRYKIKWIANGGNHWGEGVMPAIYGHDAKDITPLNAIYRYYTRRNLRHDLPTLSLPEYLYHRFIKGVKVFQPLNYIEYRQGEAKDKLSKEFGWKDYGAKHEENVLTKWFQTFYLPVKWNLDKRKPHLSSLILSGQITKKEALEELLRRPEYPITGMEKSVMKYRRREIKKWRNSGKYWRLLQKVYGLIKKRDRFHL